jgi:hypothetical protein
LNILSNLNAEQKEIVDKALRSSKVKEQLEAKRMNSDALREEFSENFSGQKQDQVSLYVMMLKLINVNLDIFYLLG